MSQFEPNTSLYTPPGDERETRRLAEAFPRHFLWGASTASYQIEGAVNEDGRGLSIWDTFAATPGNTYAGHTGAVADDHYHRMEQDIALLSDLGLNAYRFSVAWPRILPNGTGQVNERGLDFYDRLVDTLLVRSITPVLTLYHWDLPVALHDKGGWLNRDTAYAFADYAEVVARRLGDRVPYWITLNEPWCSAYLGYGNGEHAPGMRDMRSAVIAAHHLLLGHGLAMPRIAAATRSGAQAGITLNLTTTLAADDRPETREAVRAADAFSNGWFLDPVFRGEYPQGFFEQLQTPPPPIQDGDMQTIAAPMQFLGINYYQPARVRGFGAGEDTRGQRFDSAPRLSGAEYTEMGWEVYPQGLTDLLVRLTREYNPPSMLITENGAAFADTVNDQGRVADPRREAYVRAHIDAIAKAMAQGAPIHGYLLWSLLDNFEWAHGYSKRFGIVYVDYETQQRIVKDSGRWYAEFVRAWAKEPAPTR